MKKNVPAVAVIAGVLLAAASMLAVQELPLTQSVNLFIGAAPCGDYGYGWEGGPCGAILTARAPARTQEVVRRIQKELFTNQPSGLPGNDDAGALSSWYIFLALGLYPEIPGVAGFVVGSPLFPKATIHLENGSAIRIFGEGASLANPFVQTLKLNGKNYKSCWIPWSALSNGATLRFEPGDKPSDWGKNQPPPSFGSFKT